MPRCFAAELHLNTIPVGFNPLRQRLRGECPTGNSNGVELLTLNEIGFLTLIQKTICFEIYHIRLMLAIAF